MTPTSAVSVASQQCECDASSDTDAGVSDGPFSGHEKAPSGRIEAMPMGLRGAPVSDAAVVLVDHILGEYVLPRTALGDRPSSVTKARIALGALLADLYDIRRANGSDGVPLAGAHGMSPKDFRAATLGFGRNIFRQVTEGLAAAGLLKVQTGKPRWRVAFGKVFNHQGEVSTFALTQEMIDLAGQAGIEGENWVANWRAAAPKLPQTTKDRPRLVLRRAKQREGAQKVARGDMPIRSDDTKARELRQAVDRLNGFLAGCTIGGITFCGLQRIFNDGDQPGFAWNKGGRYYSLGGGDRYEGMGARRRMERITLHGEPVGEADIQASHLTLLHALLQHPFDTSEDPYHVDGIDRSVVKWWCAQALGSSNPKPRQWSAEKKGEYAGRRPGRQLQVDFPIAMVGAAVRDRHPVLAGLKECGFSTLDLQFHESEVLRRAMELLMASATPALPIHDGLIVAHGSLLAAQAALSEALQAHVTEVTGQPTPMRPRVTLRRLEDLEAGSGRE